MPVPQELTKKIGSTCEAIEEHIDPFDLNVCWPHALKYLRQFTQQSQVISGGRMFCILSRRHVAQPWVELFRKSWWGKMTRWLDVLLC